MTPLSNDSYDLRYRPDDYFWSADFAAQILSRIKGAERRATARSLIEQGRIDELPPFLAKAKLTDEERLRFGRLHPNCMGGEYLPDTEPLEIEIARITIRSTTMDVVSVYAQPGKSRIRYRVVDEYGGSTLSGTTTRTSHRPLTLGALMRFLDGAWSIYSVLEMNFIDAGFGGSLAAMLDFVISVDSEFYPRIDGLYRSRIRAWAPERFRAAGLDVYGQPLKEREGPQAG